MRGCCLWALLLLGPLACADPEDTDGGLADATIGDLGTDTGARDTGLDAGALDARADATIADADPIDATNADATNADATNADADPIDADLADVDAPDALPTDAGPVLTSTSSWSAASGTPDTACTPWILVDTATSEDPSVTGGVLTLATSVEAENMYYRQPETALITPAVLRLEARVRFVSGAASVAPRAPVALGFRLGADRKKNTLFLGDGVAFILVSENSAGPSVSIATADAPHDYAIVADLTTGAIDVSQDGISILSGATFPEPDPAALPGISFGEASIYAQGTSEWVWVRHNAYVPNPCP